MSAPSTARQRTPRDQQASLRDTHRGIIDRLADPYLTDHDRWVLGQFAIFLSGATPGPDPRAARPQPVRTLYSRVRRATL